MTSIPAIRALSAAEFDQISGGALVRSTNVAGAGTVEMAARKSGEGQKDFLVVKLKEVFITSY